MAVFYLEEDGAEVSGSFCTVPQHTTHTAFASTFFAVRTDDRPSAKRDANRSKTRKSDCHV